MKVPARESRLVAIVALPAILAATVSGGLTAVVRQAARIGEWVSAAPGEASRLVRGNLSEVCRRVSDEVPPGDAVLLRSQVDPALVPYCLFPRRVYQTGVQPETDAVYMKTLPSSYPERTAASLGVDWVMTLSLRGDGLGAALEKTAPDAP